MSRSLSEFGFVRVGVATPEVKVADIDFNISEIITAINNAKLKDCSLLLFPELAVTSYSCADLFYQELLLRKTIEGLNKITSHTKKTASTVIVGAPITDHGKMFNCAVVISSGEIKGIVPKTFLINRNEYYEERWFSSEYDRISDYITINGKEIPFGADLIFNVKSEPSFNFGIEICEDLWAVIPPSFNLALAGAHVIFNPSASNEELGKSKYRSRLVSSQSARCLSAYIYAASGPGESSTDLIFSGHSMIAEYGYILAETERYRFNTQIAIADIDLGRINYERIKNNTFAAQQPERVYRTINIELPELKNETLMRVVRATPFVPYNPAERAESCHEIFSMQTTALAKRLKYLNTHNVVIGISGGLDSTLALLVCVKTFQKLGLDLKGIHAINMPGYGTSARTKNNAEKLAVQLGLTLRTISIKASVKQHFEDIGHKEDNYDLVFENAQARERTQILMDISNQVRGIVIGTGGLSEYALGWCTFNADQISMYGVNSSIPKTLVKYIIDWCADEEFTGDTSDTLRDILDTPISPELLPLDEKGNIAQSTETSIGPYLLHDFFLFYMMRFHFSPAKILFLAEQAFNEQFPREEILNWMKQFYKRFFASQFKRSVFPDGVKVGTVAISPRGDWRMPSDASSALWLKELAQL